ncbi:MAG: hypothetical protein ACP5XB_00910, partial [Isosphaeraceae bacterium]
MAGSRMDRASTAEESPEYSGLVSRSGRTEKSTGGPAYGTSTIGGVVLAFLVGTMQPLPAQEASRSRSTPLPTAHVSIKNLPLDPAPAPAALDRATAPARLDSSAQSTQDSSVDDVAIDLKSIRAETAARLKRLDAAAADPRSGVSASSVASGKQSNLPGIRELLLERQQRLDEHEQAAAELQQLTDPKLAPERQLAASRLEVKRLQNELSQLSQNTLPPIFRVATTEVTDSVYREMKEAIEAAKTELKDWLAKLEEGRSNITSAQSTQQSLRAERDQLFHKVAALKARSHKRATGMAGATTPQARQLEQERLINLGLETTVESLRLKVAEAKLTREVKLADYRQARLLELEAHARLARKQLEQMQNRYRALAESQQLNLKQAAATQASKARRSGDPLDRYQASCQADLL